MRLFRIAAIGLPLLSVLISTLLAVTPYSTTMAPALAPLEIPINRGSAALWQSLKKLHTRASLIMVTAHPDDEDGGMLAYESRGFGARVTLLTLNRGEGGANVMSPDYWDALGLVRTEELLAAGRYYGVDQYWTRVCDYGFSKTMEEALAKWTRQRVLSDVVRVVRMTRPLVVTSVFVGGPSDGHGNHQVAGLMAKEVFEAAGDPSQFPEQIKEGLRPWKPLKYYAHVPWFGQGNKGISTTLNVPVGEYDAVLGSSYVQASRQGLGYQKTQNGGPFIPRAGAMPSAYHRFGSNVPAKDQEQTFFDGIDTTLAGIAGLTGGGDNAFLVSGLSEMNAAVEKAIADFSFERPKRCAPALARGLKISDGLIRDVNASRLSDQAKYDVLHELQIKRVQFNNAIVEALGLSMRATVRPEQEGNPLYEQFLGDPDTFRTAVPGQHFGVQVSVANQSAQKLDIARVYLDSPDENGWKTKADKPGPSSLSSDQEGNWRFTAEASDSAAYTKPYFTRPSIEQPYYDILQPQYLTLPTAPYPLRAWVEANYEGVPVKFGQVVQTVQHVTGPGVVYEPLVVGPAISLEVEPRAGIVPLGGASFDLAVKLHSNVKGPAKGSVRLNLPPGWESDPRDAQFSTEKDGEDRDLAFTIKPVGLSEKTWNIQAVASCDNKTYEEGYSVTGYQGVRPYFLYKPASPKVTGVNVKIAPGLKVAYIMGSGDDVPATLKELGINTVFLSSSDLAGANLGQFDVILLGVRAYAARPELVTYNARLLDYVKNGGVLIVQYNTPEFDHNFGPYPYKMGENPEEVTDEESKINILAPENQMFTWPNKITEADFGGWIEERGSKFLASWDANYQPMLETHDPGQAPQKGGLLYAKYGKGIYVYNAYAFYRELPEGVPGAFRLFANLLSLAKHPQ